MVRAIWVEEMNAIERTTALREGLEKHGYKMDLNEFTDVLAKRISKKKVEDLIASLKERKIVLLIAAYGKSPNMVGYGTMRLENKNGFYISYLKRGPEGTPEVRLIIETEQEFRTWLRCFVRDTSKINK